MLNSLAVTEREAFFESHGASVRIEGYFIFEDGAIAEDNPMGRMEPPSDDPHERATAIYRYWQIVAEHYTQHFEDFKSYLAGSGKREDAWATLYTEEDQIAHLRHLQDQAKRVRAKLSRAKRKVKETKPFWLEEREQQEIEDATRKQQFVEKVQSINL